MEKHMQSFAKTTLFILGCLSFLIAIIVELIVLDMFQHPRGIGMEKLAGPLFGLVGLAFLGVGIFSIRIAMALKKGAFSRAYADGSEVSGQ